MPYALGAGTGGSSANVSGGFGGFPFFQEPKQLVPAQLETGQQNQTKQ